ncbi:MAG: hypothetical protein VW891_13125 [Novosphingobium sp.]
MSKADHFRQTLIPNRRPNFHAVTRDLETNDPDLLAAILEALHDDDTNIAMIQRSLEAVGIDMGYSSVIRWREHVRR